MFLVLHDVQEQHLHSLSFVHVHTSCPSQRLFLRHAGDESHVCTAFMLQLTQNE